MTGYSLSLIIAGGIYHLFFGLFHLSFWRAKFLCWEEELPRMSPANRAVIQMLNVAVIVFMFMIAFISFEYSQELITSSLGKVLLLCTSLFWLARLVGEFTLKARFAVKPALVVAFAIGILLYLLPIVI